MAGYGRMAWDEGQRYVEDDKRARVPMREIIGRAGDVPARPKAPTNHNELPSAGRQFLETSLSQLARIPKELGRNLTELVKQYGPGAAEMAAGALPGAGYAQSFQDYRNASQAFREGSYGQAALHGAQGVFNQVAETVAPMLPTLAAVPPIPAAARDTLSNPANWTPPPGTTQYSRTRSGEFEPAGHTQVLADVPKVDASLARDPGNYVGPGGEGGIRDRYKNFGEWLAQRDQQGGVEAPRMAIGPRGEATVGNGRHRFGYARDAGVEAVPVVVPNEQAGEFATRFGTAPPLTDLRIAGRMPTAKTNVTEDFQTQDLVADVASMRRDPEYFAKSTENLRGIVPDRIMASADPEEKWGAAQALMMSNLDQIYRRMDPEVARRSTLWYPGGRRMAEELGQETGVPVQSAAAAIAALSPQKNWFENVDLAQRTLRSLAEDPIITPEMVNSFRGKASGTATKGYASKADALDRLVGKRLSEIEDPQQAALGVVAHDFHTRPRSFQNLSPEGLSQGLQLIGKPGQERPANVAWQSTNAVGKAVSAFRSGGDLSKISPLMGEKNKVRNFYNDVVAPDRTDVVGGKTFQDYTNDTHNIAASLLRPLGSKDLEVEVGLGLSGGASSKVGMGGLYGLYADTGRELARQYDVAPSQMQSPTWEGVRSLYPSEWKTQGNKDAMAELWRQYRAGERTLSSVQEQIFRQADEQGRTVNRPPWLRQ
jgi:hypothetical protein